MFLYLYLIRFDQMFKIGITKDFNRIYRLVNVYKNFVPKLHESYLLQYYRESIVRDIEALIKDYFVEFTFDFEGEAFDGYTECFMDECFNEVLKIVEFHVHINNKNKTDLNKKMILEKGITRKEQLFITGEKTVKEEKRKDKNKKQPKTFFKFDENSDTHFLRLIEDNKNNVSVDIKEKNKIYWMTIHFQNHKWIDTQSVGYTYRIKEENRAGGGYLILSQEYKYDNYSNLTYLTFEVRGNPCHRCCLLEFTEVTSFYNKLFIILNLESVWEKIINEYIIELKTYYPN